MIRETTYNLIVEEMPKKIHLKGKLILLAELLASNKSALCHIASLAFSFVLIPTSSNVWHLAFLNVSVPFRCMLNAVTKL